MKGVIVILFVFCLTGCSPVIHKEYGNSLDERFTKELEATGYLRKPLKVNYIETANKRWDEKEVIESRLLNGMESFDNIRLINENEGRFSLSSEKKVEGNYSIKVVSPTKGSRISRGRPWFEIGPMHVVENENWTEWNRISVWVYPEFEGHQHISIQLKVFTPYRENDAVYVHDILCYFLLKNNEWNHLVWEIPHMRRDSIQGFSINYRSQGNELTAADTITFYVDNLRLEKVKADKTEGWDTDQHIISYSHTGYETNGKKIAFTSNMEAKEFKIVDENGKTVLKKKSEQLSSPVGTFNLFDFSELHKEGVYMLKAGNTGTREFSISNRIWDRTIWKTLNLFFALRCGYPVEGVHEICHSDLIVEHEGKQIVANGGWHDAGDLSQGVINTAEAVYSMIELARTVKDSDRNLYNRIMEEAEWGAQWLLKMRFGEGYRHTWTTMDFWTDGIIGTIDDVTERARNSAYENSMALRAEASAARELKDISPAFAEHCRKAAIQDWEFTLPAFRRRNLEVVSEVAFSAIEMYRLTGENKYLEQAVELADYILQSQAKEPVGREIPLTGFFYTSPDKRDVYQFAHRGHDQAPVVVLAALYKAFPSSPKREEWYAAIKLYGDYIKTVVQLSAPYKMLPSGGPYKLVDGWQRDQILEGIQLDENHYFRFFPVWGEGRGNSGVMLSQAKGVSAAAEVLNDNELRDIVMNALQWHLGLNPVSESLMYSEGYNYSAQYTATSGDIVGSLPVGIMTNGNKDVPLYPAQNCWPFKEVWVHPSSRWLWIMSDILKH